jgi:hypothetical protein
MPKRKAPEPEPDAFERIARELGCEDTGGAVPDDPEQYQRFVEAAQELGADSPEAGAAFEQALRRVLSRRAPNGPASKRELGRKPKQERRRRKIPE